MKRVVVLSVLTAVVAVAEARPFHFRVSHPTNATEVGGVKMPPKYTVEEWAEREAVEEEFRKRMQEVDERIEARWFASLTKEQRDALDAEKAAAAKANEEAFARQNRRRWECEALTNRLKWVKNEYATRRRIERDYHPGLKWMDSEIVKETITIGESGRVRIHFLYTADGKKHRIDPDAIEREIAKRRLDSLANTILED